MATSPEANTYARTIEYWRRQLQQAENKAEEFSRTPERLEYRQAQVAAAGAKTKIAELTAGLSALTAPVVQEIKAKQTSLQVQAQAGPRSTPTPLLYPEVNKTAIPLPSGMIQALKMGSVSSMLAGQTARAAVQVPTYASTVAKQTTPQGVLGATRSFIQQNPILSVTGVGVASGLLGYAVGRTTGGSSRAINPRTGKPYRRTNPTNFKALSRAIRRVNSFTKANNKVEKALRAAARSAR